MRILLAILTCFALQNANTQTSAVSGTVLDLATKNPLAGAKVTLQTGIGKSKETIATATTDTTGIFIFKNIQPGQYSLYCFYKMAYNRPDLPKELLDNIGRYDIDSTVTALAGQTYNHNFYLQVTCPYDKTKGQDYCPACKKKDMVQEIVWGLPVLNRDGKYIFKGKERDINEFYPGGCSPDSWCNPSKHCKRCNIDF